MSCACTTPTLARRRRQPTCPATLLDEALCSRGRPPGARRPPLRAHRRRRLAARAAAGGCWLVPLVLVLHRGAAQAATRDCSTSPAGARDIAETACPPRRPNLNPDVRYFKVTVGAGGADTVYTSIISPSNATCTGTQGTHICSAPLDNIVTYQIYSGQGCVPDGANNNWADLGARFSKAVVVCSRVRLATTGSGSAPTTPPPWGATLRCSRPRSRRLTQRHRAPSTPGPPTQSLKAPTPAPPGSCGSKRSGAPFSTRASLARA